MRRPAMSTVLLAAVAATLPLTLAACQSSPFDPERDRLEDARDRWRSLEISSYSYAYEAACFCGPTATQPVRVEVVDGEVVSITSIETGEPAQPAVPAEDPADFLTVEGLFGFLRDALRQDPASFDASYHPELGHPTSASIDFDERVADEEFAFEVSELSVIEDAVRVAPRR